MATPCSCSSGALCTYHTGVTQVHICKVALLLENELEQNEFKQQINVRGLLESSVARVLLSVAAAAATAAAAECLCARECLTARRENTLYPPRI